MGRIVYRIMVSCLTLFGVVRYSFMRFFVPIGRGPTIMNKHFAKSFFVTLVVVVVVFLVLGPQFVEV